MAASLVKGIQSNNMSACIKHYILNNQEYNRLTMSVTVSNRVLHEVYLPGFKAAVDAGVGSVMCSYNRINGTFGCDENTTLVKIFEERFGFKGWVCTDGMSS